MKDILGIICVILVMFSSFGALVLHTPTPLYATAIAGALLGFLKWSED